MPAQASGAPVKVVSAMYQKSPLGLGLRPDSNVESLRYAWNVSLCGKDGCVWCACYTTPSMSPSRQRADSIHQRCTHPSYMQGPSQARLPHRNALRLADARAGHASASRHRYAHRLRTCLLTWAYRCEILVVGTDLHVACMCQEVVGCHPNPKRASETHRREQQQQRNEAAGSSGDDERGEDRPLARGEAGRHPGLDPYMCALGRHLWWCQPPPVSRDT